MSDVELPEHLVDGPDRDPDPEMARKARELILGNVVSAELSERGYKRTDTDIDGDALSIQVLIAEASKRAHLEAAGEAFDAFHLAIHNEYTDVDRCEVTVLSTEGGRLRCYAESDWFGDDTEAFKERVAETVEFDGGIGE